MKFSMHPPLISSVLDQPSINKIGPLSRCPHLSTLSYLASSIFYANQINKVPPSRTFPPVCLTSWNISSPSQRKIIRKKKPRGIYSNPVIQETKDTCEVKLFPLIGTEAFSIRSGYNTFPRYLTDYFLNGQE